MVIILKKYSEGDCVLGVVTGIESYGIFLVLDDNCSGLVHISEISNDFVKNIYDYANVGDKLSVKIIGNDVNGHYKLSLKDTYNTFRNGYERIKETSNGFNGLACNLDKWIDDCLYEIKKNS